MDKIFEIPEKGKINTRSQSGVNLVQPYRLKLIGQKAMSYIGPKVWNQLPKDIKEATSVNYFKHRVKQLYFEKISNANT